MRPEEPNPFFVRPQLRASCKSGASGTSRPSDFWIEEVALSEILGRVPTPFYVTSLTAVEDRVCLYRDVLQQFFPSAQVYYALKANWGEPIVQTVRDCGEGFDIVSLGELHHLIRQGVQPESICFAGVGKTTREIEEAIATEVGILNIEHVGELKQALRLLQKKPSTTRLALRLNPCLEIETHPHLRTGALDSKFGLLQEQILSFLDGHASLLQEKSARGAPLSEAVCGVHVHVGSQLLSGTLFSQVVGAVTSLSSELLKRGVRVSHLDFGGGLGVPFAGVPADGSDIRSHIANLHQALKESVQRNSALTELWGEGFENCQICLEPGRSVVASSTIFVTRVLYTRENDPDHRFAYVDGGMNDFPRPALYDAQHAVCVGATSEEDARQDEGGREWGAPVQGGKGLQIVGPVCESGDVLSRDADIGETRVGDSLVFLESGAYCRSMASGYNLRRLPAALFVRGKTLIL